MQFILVSDVAAAYHVGGNGYAMTENLVYAQSRPEILLPDSKLQNYPLIFYYLSWYAKYISSTYVTGVTLAYGRGSGYSHGQQASYGMLCIE